jgi:hypothetical protein
MKRKSEFLILPNSKDGDSRDSSLVVYTITVAIAISLFIFVFTVDRKLLWSVLLSILSAALYLASSIKTFTAIELLVDITSFQKNNSGDEERFKKYKRVLLNYNYSIILIIGSTILLFVNIIFKYVIAFNLPYFSCLKNDCVSLRPIINLLLLCISLIATYPLITKWRKDIKYVNRATLLVDEGIGSD